MSTSRANCCARCRPAAGSPGPDTDYRQLQVSNTAGPLRIRTLARLPAGALACAGTLRGHTPPVGPVQLEFTLPDAGSGYLLDGERLLDAAHQPSG